MSPATSLEALREAAVSAMQHAYAPYSDFRVGVALRATDGSVFVGCNVENSSFPSGTCAERAALGAAVVGGQREFTHLVICTDADDPTPPCGMCRQALVEFAPALEIVSYAASGEPARWTIAALLPTPFTPQSLHHR